MAITAEMVKTLREQTGAGMMDCKKALGETGGDMQAAVDWLRTKGLAAAAKKAGRVAAEGRVVCLAEGAGGVMVEVNTETDFTAKNDNFVAFADTVARLALADPPADTEALKAMAYPETGRNVGEELGHLIATIGENMNLRRYSSLRVGQGVVASYIHMGGKIGVLVALESAADAAALQELGKKVAMQVAAASPAYLDRNAVDAAALEREKAVLAEQARASGKSGDIVDKMVLGRLNKFYGEVCLLDQPFIMDDKQTVTQVVNAAGKELGAPVKVTGFARFALGEGLAKKEENFAEEVAKQMG